MANQLKTLEIKITSKQALQLIALGLLALFQVSLLFVEATRKGVDILFLSFVIIIAGIYLVTFATQLSRKIEVSDSGIMESGFGWKITIGWNKIIGTKSNLTNGREEIEYDHEGNSIEVCLEYSSRKESAFQSGCIPMKAKRATWWSLFMSIWDIKHKESNNPIY